MNPTTLHVLDYTLDASGGLATITIASPDNLISCVYTTRFYKAVDNTPQVQVGGDLAGQYAVATDPVSGIDYAYGNPTFGPYQRAPNNGF